MDYLSASRAGEVPSARVEGTGVGRAVTPGGPGRGRAPVYAPRALGSIIPTPEEDL